MESFELPCLTEPPVAPEDAPVAAAVPLEPPREGSAAWRAEQVATGQIQIPSFRPHELSRTIASSPEPVRVARPHHHKVAAAIGIVVAVLAVWFFLQWDGRSAAEEAFVPLSGYAYGEEDSEMTKMLEDQVNSIPALEENSIEFHAREVTKDSQPVAFAMVIGVDPDKIPGDPFEGIGASTGQILKPVTLGFGARKFTAYELQHPMGAQLLLYDEGLFITVAGVGSQDVRAITTQLGAARI